jgi:hypothetical protein
MPFENKPAEAAKSTDDIEDRIAEAMLAVRIAQPVQAPRAIVSESKWGVTGKASAIFKPEPAKVVELPEPAKVVELRPQAQAKPKPAPDPDRFQPRDARPVETSDDNLALAYAEKYAADLRYVAIWGQWLRWHQGCWRREDTKLALDLARDLCRDIGEDHGNSLAVQLTSRKTISAVEALAQVDRRIAATSDQWDSDPASGHNQPQDRQDAGTPPGRTSSRR